MDFFYEKFAYIFLLNSIIPIEFNPHAIIIIIIPFFMLGFFINIVLYLFGNILYEKHNSNKFFNLFKIKTFNNIFLYTYIFRFLPFGGFIGSFLSGVNKKDKVIRHIFYSYLIFLFVGYSLLYFITLYFNNTVILKVNSLLFSSFSNYMSEDIYPVITFITLLIIGIFGTIGYYLGKIKK